MGEDLSQYLKELNFDKQYEKLIKKYKNKKIVIYGAGQLFQEINSKYDLSKLNIIAISDGKYTDNDTGEEFLGYKKVPVDKIVFLKPDVILVSILMYVPVIENFEENIFKNKNIKIRPFVQKKFLTVLKEIWK